MRYMLLGLVVGTCLSSIEGFAQTADFKCAKEGTIVGFTDGSKLTWGAEQLQSWGAEQARYCFIKTEGQPSSWTERKAWYGPAAVVDAGGPGWYARQTKIYTIWPLSVGKKVSGRADGSTSGNAQGGSRHVSSTVTIQVERFEKVTTKAGTFDAFVVSSFHEDIGGSFKWRMREWYTPDLGIVVKREAHNANHTVDWKAEAVSISLPK